MFAKNFAQIFPRFHPFDDGLESVDQLECRLLQEEEVREGFFPFRFRRGKNPLLFQGRDTAIAAAAS